MVDPKFSSSAQGRWRRRARVRTYDAGRSPLWHGFRARHGRQPEQQRRQQPLDHSGVILDEHMEGFFSAYHMECVEKQKAFNTGRGSMKEEKRRSFRRPVPGGADQLDRKEAANGCGVEANGTHTESIRGVGRGPDGWVAALVWLVRAKWARDKQIRTMIERQQEHKEEKPEEERRAEEERRGGERKRDEERRSSLVITSSASRSGYDSDHSGPAASICKACTRGWP